LHLHPQDHHKGATQKTLGEQEMTANNQPSNRRLTLTPPKGQGLLELALVLPVLLMVLFGVFDLGRVYFSTITLVNAAREGARYLTSHPDDLSTGFVGTEQAAINEASSGGITLLASQVDVTVCDDDDSDGACDSGSIALVTVTHDFELVLGWFLPSPITVTRTAEMVVP
jgi:Flp pilus assembly protein TadG